MSSRCQTGRRLSPEESGNKSPYPHAANARRSARVTAGEKSIPSLARQGDAEGRSVGLTVNGKFGAFVLSR